MSWTATIGPATVDEVDELIRHRYDAETRQKAHFGGPETPEHLRQFEMAMLHLNTLLSIGVTHDNGSQVKISLCGHANEDFKPKPGWADTYLSISISEIRE